MNNNQDPDEGFKAIVYATLFFGALVWVTITGRLPNPQVNHNQPIIEEPRNAGELP